MEIGFSSSSVVTLSRQETLFLNAVQGYLKGGPIMDDKEFDALKLTLSKAGSRIATNTEPKCYLDTGVCTVTFVEDTFRQAVLYAPAALVGTLLWSVFSFEVLPLQWRNAKSFGIAGGWGWWRARGRGRWWGC